MDPIGAPSSENRLQLEVESLRANFADTKELYRAVCGLLFFNHGQIPTSNKLYSLVRKGSMGTPVAVLQQFWQELREKSRVRIEHPDMPEDIKSIAAETIQGLWLAATKSAAMELSSFREEARREVVEAHTQRQQTQTALDYARQEIAAGTDKLLEAEQRYDALQAELSQARAARAAAEAREENLKDQLAERQAFVEVLQEQHAEVAREAKARLDQAEERSAANERRLMLQLDEVRVQRQRTTQQLEESRAELANVRTALKNAEVQYAADSSRTMAELSQATRQLSTADQLNLQLKQDLAIAGEALTQSQLRAERAETEVAVTRKMLATLAPAEKKVRVKSGPPSSKNKGK